MMFTQRGLDHVFIRMLTHISANNHCPQTLSRFRINAGHNDSDYAEIRSLYIIDAAADAVGDSTPHPRDFFARRGFAI